MKPPALFTIIILLSCLFLYTELYAELYPELYVEQGKAKSLLTKEQLPPLHHRSHIIMPDSLLIPSSLIFEETDNKQQKIVCKTCHGIKDIQDKAFDQVDKYDDNFLTNGPYKPLSDFCYLCHKRKENKRENIHILLDAQTNKVTQKKEQQCLYCHTRVLKQDELIATNDRKLKDIKLRLPIEKICYGCHLRTPHLNALEHQVKISDEDMLLHIEKSRKHYQVTLPLGQDNQVLCVTCHDPHQQGVLQVLQKDEQEKNLQVSTDLIKGITYQQHPWAEVYANDKADRLQQMSTANSLHYQRISNEVLLRLPAKNGTLCIACHDFSQERLW